MYEMQNRGELNSMYTKHSMKQFLTHSFPLIQMVVVNSPSSPAKGLLCMESQSERQGDTGGRLGATLHTTTPLLVVPQRILGESG